MPFQGRLSAPNGDSLADGARVVQFKMYDAPVGGRAVWNGEVHQLSVNGGMVNTILGSKSSLGGVNFSGTLYLEVTVDANADGSISPVDPPLLPRQMILPAPFAVKAARADVATRSEGADDSRTLNGKTWSSIMTGNDPAASTLRIDKIADESIPASKLAADSRLPIGTIVQSLLAPAAYASVVGDPEAFDAAASKWVAADGAHDISSTAYGQLTGQSTTPDLRGVFLRGLNQGREDEFADPDAAREVGALQKHAFESHTHRIPIDYFENTGGAGWSMTHGQTAWGAHRGESYAEGTAPETRPTNVAVYRYLRVN